MTKVVLDASALLAVMNKEPGANIVLAALSDAAISAVNYSEVLKKTIERNTPTDGVIAFVSGWPIEIVPFDEELAGASASLYPNTKAYGLSFADRACLALGIKRNCTVLTSERRIGDILLPITVKLIRHVQ